MNQLEIALKYAERGIKIFPCNIKKAPAIKHGKGFRDATSDPAKIKEWWTKFPDALVGSPNDQFTVIDCDSHNLCYVGKMLHEDAVTRLKQEQIITDDAIEVRTISGGTHYYFKKDSTATRQIKCLPFIDLLADGGYVILPDQTHYVAKNTNTPWEEINKLPKFKFKDFALLVDEFEDANIAAKELKSKKAQKRPDAVKKTIITKTICEQQNRELTPEEELTIERTPLYKRTERDRRFFSRGFLVSCKGNRTEGRTLLSQLYLSKEDYGIVG
jgi:hypothetical protein